MLQCHPPLLLLRRPPSLSIVGLNADILLHPPRCPVTAAATVAHAVAGNLLKTNDGSSTVPRRGPSAEDLHRGRITPGPAKVPREARRPPQGTSPMDRRMSLRLPFPVSADDVVRVDIFMRSRRTFICFPCLSPSAVVGSTDEPPGWRGKARVDMQKDR